MPRRRLRWLTVVGVAVCSFGACKREGDGSSSSHLGNCADPIILTGTTTLGTETTAGAQQTLSAADPTCLGAATLGPERVYQVTVPENAATRWRVTVTPTEAPGPAAFDPVVYLVRDCVERPTCVEAEDRRGGGSLELVEHASSVGPTGKLFVVVDGYDYQPQGGAYRLGLEVLPP